ncbi:MULTISPECIES: BhlA/UviB family holin-like peptide [Bacillus cereus group]|uniref:Bacteriocin biosynthesis protein n=2 Tax=Bacillus cereus group TaxID=86661 RepID=A0A2B9DPD2_BACCE|nr:MULTISPECIES: BhlA/UviB family holin-like peptide [Bacillus cereus group]MEB9620873.1 BhlA/UviB family holin-like peptide [Bacillus cereus]OUB51134.1 bacteriocin biosynthesis protein [Bacillus thuringiensis serovar iberica]PGM94548.1 bacteriocin biosynthesis protein [Bacillus cereus]HDR5353623.1 bacteriocin biosynthesis protein [Bacillus thuringiensis]
MEEQVFNVMLSQGAFGALFVWLLFSTRKESKELLESTRQENKEREDKYQQVIEKNQEVIEEQAKAFGSLSKEVSEIKQILGTKGEK